MGIFLFNDLYSSELLRIGTKHKKTKDKPMLMIKIIKTIFVLLLFTAIKVEATTSIPDGLKIERLWLDPIGTKYAPLIGSATGKANSDINWRNYLRDCPTDAVFGIWSGENAYGTEPVTFVNYEKIFKSGREYLAILSFQGQVWGVSIIDNANRDSVSTNVETPVSKFLVDIDTEKYLSPSDDDSSHVQVIAAVVNNKPGTNYGNDVNIIYVKFTRLA